MDQRQADKTLIIANGAGVGADSLIESCRPRRNITLFEEQVLRAVHHEFDAMTQEEAAIALDVSPMRISRALADMEERSKTCKPIQIMFPILTKRQFEVYTCIVKLGLTVAETAEQLGFNAPGGVVAAIVAMRAKGMNIPRQKDKPKPVSYTPSMDKDVKEKF